ncbi:MAG: tetratricopeptide repeat protein [Leptospirillia bacterium]
MDDVVSVTTRSIERALKEGLACFDDGGYEEALRLFDDALTRFGPNLDLTHWKGITLRHMGRLREAIEALEISGSGNTPEGSLYELAALLIEEGVDAERGVGILETLSDGGDLPAREYLAHRAYEHGHFERVVALSRMARKQETEQNWIDSVECLETLEGIALTEMGQLDEARFHLKKAARRNPGCGTHQTKLGRVFQREKSQARAHHCDLRAIELDTDDPIPQVNLAHLYDEMGRAEASHQVFAAVHQANPQDTGTIEDYARFLSRHGKLDEAVRLIERALQYFPEGDAAEDLSAFLGWLAMDSGDKARARAIWEEQISHRPRAFAARHYLAGMLAETGDTGAALDLLEVAHGIDAVATKNWCVRPDGKVEPCFLSLAADPRFIRITGPDNAGPGSTGPNPVEQDQIGP